jgi:hypothetical protein
MTESVTETLIDFVTTNYTRLLPSVKTDDKKINEVIHLIEKLFKTFKTPDSKHDAIVDQLAKLQAAHTALDLDPTEYPHHNNALVGLNAIVDELEEYSGAKGEE